jgi:hypothetical protein
MNSKVIASVAIALSLIVVGWMLFRPKDSAAPNDETGDGDSPPNFDPENPPEKPVNKTGSFTGEFKSIMELANGSGSAEEIYDLLVNATDNMESLLNQTTKDVLEEKLAPMVEALKELKTDVGGMIAEEASDEEVRSLVSSKLEELFGERPQPPKTK